jgi:hypothetical protein
MNEQYLYRLTNFNECHLIDAFNLEFCESPNFSIDQTHPSLEKMEISGNIFTFQIQKEFGRCGI